MSQGPRSIPAPEPSVEGFWDGAYRRGEHLAHWHDAHPSWPLAHVLASGQVRAGQRALDVGCGAGHEAVYLARHGLRVVAVDVSRRALHLARGHARRAGVRVAWVRAGALALPLADQACHLVHDRGCFHLFDDDLRAAYAAEIGRVTAPGGRVLLIGAAADDEEAGLFAVDAVAVDHWFGPTHLRRLGPAMPVDLVAPAGTLPGRLVVLGRSGSRPRDTGEG